MAHEEEILLVDFDSVYWICWHSTGAEDSADMPAKRTVGRIRAWAQQWPHVAVCFDVGRTWRHELSPAYKANRDAKPEEALAQRKNALGVLSRDGFPMWSAEGYEADDVIASAVRVAKERGIRSTIATADKDLMQLVDDHCVVLSTRTDNFLGPAEVREKFGVEPGQIADWLALVGDKSDNVAGVPGIGEKRAADLLFMHRDIVRLVGAAEDPASDITPKIRESIVNHKNAAALALRLVTLRADVPVPFDEVMRPRETKPLTKPVEEFTMSTEETATATAAEPMNVDCAPVAESASMVVDQPAPVQPAQEFTPAQTAPVVARPIEWNHLLEASSLRDAVQIAKHLHNSRLFPHFNNPEGIFAAQLLARSHGIESMKVLMPGMLHNIKGKLSMSAQMIVGLVLRSGKCEYFDCIETTAAKAVYVTKRKGAKHEVRFEFTIEEAKAAGYLGKADSSWQKTPKTMLRHRCETELARAVFPDVVGGLYSPEEIEAA